MSVKHQTSKGFIGTIYSLDEDYIVIYMCPCVRNVIYIDAQP
jgi:hypothetical protein